MKKNTLLEYSVVTFIVTAAVSITLALTLANSISDYQFKSHIRLYPELVQMAFRENREVYTFFRQGRPAKPDDAVVPLFRSLLNLGTIFRVKVWTMEGQILWSDQSILIGQKFTDDDALNEARKGLPVYEIGENEKNENIEEKDRGTTLQIYTPLIQNGGVVGVVEFYESNGDLFAKIAQNTAFVWIIVLFSGAILYSILFLVFFRAYKAQKEAHRQLLETQDVTIFALAYQAELRDEETGRHLERTSRYVGIISDEMSKLPSLRGYLTSQYITDLVKSAPLHDIGKVAVPDAILHKPGPLTSEERAIVEKHCEDGAKILTVAESKLHFRSFLEVAVQLARSHHEKWDGTGYPQGLVGEAIPLSARIMALADVYDALRTKRPYKEAFAHAKCVSIVEEQRGRHFDPVVVDAFLRREKDFEEISDLHSEKV